VHKNVLGAFVCQLGLIGGLELCLEQWDEVSQMEEGVWTL